MFRAVSQGVSQSFAAVNLRNGTVALRSLLGQKDYSEVRVLSFRPSLPSFEPLSSAPLVDRKKSRVREPSQANRVPAWLRLLPLSRPLRRPCQTRPPAPCPNGVLAPGA